MPACAAAFLAAATPTAALAAGGSGLTGSRTPKAGKATATGTDATPARTTTRTTPTTINGGAGVAGPIAAPSSPSHPTVPGDTAQIIGGVAFAPALAPAPVRRAIWAGDQIRTRPYILGGGHVSFISGGYDCSGSVSYVLHGAGLLSTPEDSGQLESWGDKGLGQWITVYTNPAHAFVQIAGVRFDTSAEDDPNPPAGTGPRWRPLMTAASGFVARHPASY
jgi:cell wall-associated NlpC family hydrolase